MSIVGVRARMGPALKGSQIEQFKTNGTGIWRGAVGGSGLVKEYSQYTMTTRTSNNGVGCM